MPNQPSILIVQVDSRIHDEIYPYWRWTTRYNRLMCERLKWDYRHIHQPTSEGYSGHWAKIFGLIENWRSFKEYDLVMYLDTDAWIRDGKCLRQLLLRFHTSPYRALFSEDEMTKVNTGVFCFRARDTFIRNLIVLAAGLVTADSRMTAFRNQRLYDQSVVDMILDEDEMESIMLIPYKHFAVDGSIVCHSWVKRKIYDRLRTDTLQNGFDLMQIFGTLDRIASPPEDSFQKRYFKSDFE